MNYITELFSPSDANSIEWQKKQPPSHYEFCSMWNDYYKAMSGKVYIPTDVNVCRESSSIYFVYCFGDYAPLIINQPLKDPTNYYMTLIDLYEYNKGIVRKYFKGEPSNIILLRKAVKEKNYDILKDIDFESDKYDYTRMHAHTIVQNSLSRFISCLIGNTLYWSQNYNKFWFDAMMCKRAYEEETIVERIKSNVTSVKKTESIDIRRNKSGGDLILPRSWPSFNNDDAKCDKCKKTVHVLEGNYKHTCK